MAGRTGTELAESMLDAAGSLHQLQEELDRISLRYCSAASSPAWPARKKSDRKKKSRNVPIPVSHRNDTVMRGQEDQDTISLESSGQASSLSSSSRFDSAIGSLHSQTDESLSSQLFLHHGLQRSPSLPKCEHHASHSPTHLTHGSSATEYGSIITVEQYYSPEPAVPTIVTTADVEEHGLRCNPQTIDSSTGECITVMGTQVHLRRRTNREKLEDMQKAAGDKRRHFKWLESSFDSTSQEETSTADLDTCCSAGRNGGGEVELESEGSSSTVVAEETERGGSAVSDIDHYTESFPPDDRRSTLEVNQPLPTGSRLASTPEVSEPPSTATAQLQEETGGREQSRQPPRRNASILQRLRRRRGSFRRDRRPRRRMPVQRSFSDRFVYHLKKRWEDQEQEEQHIISTPSLPRPIGRLLRTYAGRLHVIQLYKPADGRYGIYIKQGADQKIFISRFATAMAEKFYAGLLRPGDEIVSVNKQKIRGSSLDSVYALLSELDSVIIAVVPVTAHRNW